MSKSDVLLVKSLLFTILSYEVANTGNLWLTVLVTLVAASYSVRLVFATD